MEPTEKNDEGGKVEKQFSAVIKKLSILLGGETKLVVSKRLPANQTDDLVAELFKEDNEILRKSIKEQLRETLKAYSEMKAQVKIKQQELAKLEQEKKKEFTKKANDLLNKFEGIESKNAEFGNSLKEVAESDTEEAAEKE